MPVMTAACSLEQALASWPSWGLALSTKPKLVSALASGRTNQSYLIEANQQCYVLRLNHSEPALLGICRETERKVLASLQSSGLVPKLIFSSTKDTYTVFECLSGRTWCPQDFRKLSQRRKLVHAIGRFQACQPNIEPFDYVQHLQAYWHQFKSKQPKRAAKLSRRWHSFFKRLRLYQQNTAQWVLVHHDLVPANIIEHEGRLRIIDWEYAGLGLPGLDLAFVERHSKQKTRYPKTKQGHFLAELVEWMDELWWGIR